MLLEIERNMNNQSSRKKVTPFIGFVLFLVSLVLFFTTGLIGFVYGLIFTSTKGFQRLGDYLLKVATSVDLLGNVMMQHMLNHIMIKKNGYKFGHRKETISSVIGRNVKRGTLSPFGKLIDKILNAIDDGHSLNSIDYKIDVGPIQKILKKESK